MQELNLNTSDIRQAIESLQQQQRQLQASLMQTQQHHSAPIPPAATPRPQPPVIYRSPEQAVIDTYFKQNSVEYRALETAKSCGWESGNLDNIFNKFKAKATNNIRQKDTSEMRTIMQAVMCEIDKAAGSIVLKDKQGQISNTNSRGWRQGPEQGLRSTPEGQVQRQGQVWQFLDVCCGPGGFTEYVLSKAPDSIGMGITLPVEQGGHPMGIPNSRRFWCQYADIMENPKELLFCPPYQNQPVMPNMCNLVILDGHYLSGTDRNNSGNGSAAQSSSAGPLRSSRSIGNLSGPLPPPPGFPTPISLNMSESSPLPEITEISNLLHQINENQAGIPSPNSYLDIPGGGSLVPLQQSAQSELQLQLGAFDMLPKYGLNGGGSSLMGSSMYDYPSGELPSVPSNVLPTIQTQLLNSTFNSVAQSQVSQKNPEEVSFEVSKTQNLLWVAQLLVGVQNLAEGGNLVMRSSTKPDFYLCIVTCLMTKFFRGEVKPVKPTVSHMMRSSFYVVYKDFDLKTAQKMNLSSLLNRMFQELQCARAGDGMWPMIEGISEFRDARAFIESWGPSLLSFMAPLWRFQTLALTAMVHDHGSGRVMGMSNKTKMCFYHVLGQCKRVPEQCWYAHEFDQLTFLLKEACKTKYKPLVAPWSPLTLPADIAEAIKQLNLQDEQSVNILSNILQGVTTNNSSNYHR